MLQQFEPFEFPAHRLGSGAFGAVYRARHRVDQTYYAVKVVNLMMKTPITENAVAKFVSDVRERIMREVDALSRLSHPNVLRYFSSWVDPPSLLHQKSTKLQAKIQVQPAARKAIMNRLAEFQTQAFSDSESDTESETSTTSYSCTSSAGTVTGGNVVATTDGTPRRVKIGRVFIQTELCSGTLEEWSGDPTILRGYLRDILNGLAHIHAKGFTHRDVKPANIFLTCDPPRAVLGDLGLTASLATIYDPFEGHHCHATSGAGTPRYMAPEQTGTSYGPPVDIWAFGVMLIELTLKPKTNFELKEAVRTINTDAPFYGPDFEFHGLVKRCLQVDPENRPTAQDLLRDDFFSMEAELMSLRQRVAELTG
ncbi:eukaryotic translation initiation factor 2-alpha kinase 1 [Carpediemonas membranifera]|uniref:Eukaryotic translation initiation factor 2-alpha kinase 1 n=1 Tax=Carpediemonas membranifera TaxID=201153 RepID=A0A8J6B4H8_9EUKA|nr:eukaryotic translation initiation factor 2-alpha kinase 1 [Carpediemonas membranifera]|eukprot:KAG9392732.1 eukaryotic translation initiation factor 2-alpha kinase 1 [Carpediemonas membranifera]